MLQDRLQKLRAKIRSGGDADRPEYDDLDVIVNRLLCTGRMPAPKRELEAEMVEFYKTPARVVFELVERVSFGPEDVFFDLGSGLGQVVLLAHLLTGVAARGVEIEPAYCEYARGCARRLGLSGVDFVEGDARVADLSAGTVFYLFTPFKGMVLSQVMERVRMVASSREIRVVSYGPCSEELARLDWLRREENGEGGVYSLKIFSSYGQPRLNPVKETPT
jgi:SAM-dependent methyltransferase